MIVESRSSCISSCGIRAKTAFCTNRWTDRDLVAEVRFTRDNLISSPVASPNLRGVSFHEAQHSFWDLNRTQSHPSEIASAQVLSWHWGLSGDVPRSYPGQKK